jgi:transposase
MGFDKRGGKYFMGIDLHKKKSAVCVRDSKGEECRRETVVSSREGLGDLLAEYRPKRVVVVVEAGPCTGWAVDLMREMGHEPEVANPYRVRLIAKDREKSDRRDARHLAELGWLGAVPRAHIPRLEVRAERTLLRYRAQLARDRSGLSNQMHALVARNGYGYEAPSLFTKKGREWLEGLALAELEREVLMDLLARRGEVTGRIRALDRLIRERYRDDPLVELVRTMPGIGLYLAALILAEIDGGRRFGSFKELVSYSGLAPGGHQSGEVAQHRPITRQGSAWLRWAMVEAAQTVKWQRKGPLYGWYCRRVRVLGEKKATVALAHKMLKIIHSMLKSGRPFEYVLPTRGSGGARAAEV